MKTLKLIEYEGTDEEPETEGFPTVAKNSVADRAGTVTDPVHTSVFTAGQLQDPPADGRTLVTGQYGNPPVLGNAEIPTSGEWAVITTLLTTLSASAGFATTTPHNPSFVELEPSEPWGFGNTPWIWGLSNESSSLSSSRVGTLMIVRLTRLVWLSEGLVPVRVSVYVPGVALDETVIVSG